MVSNEAYAEESEKLAAVIDYIENQLGEWITNQPVTASNQEAADMLQRLLQELGSGFRTALDQPFFGRLNFLVLEAPPRAWEKASSTMCAYLGPVTIPQQEVFSWTAPVARLWYTETQDDRDSEYSAPSGRVLVRIRLKRYIRTRNKELVGVRDIYQRALPSPASNGASPLAEILSASGNEEGLRVIIETIQPDQYEAIANTSDKVLIVQGAAGSGKSEIGLHRIAYLLSPFNELPQSERPTAGTTLFVGPSKSFLEYTGDLLPGLGVERGVEHTTRGAWMQERRSTRVRFDGRVWNDLLARGEMTLYSERATAFKGSLAMVEAVERYVARRVAQIRKDCRALQQSIPLPSVRLADVAAALAATSPERDMTYPNKSRREFIQRIVRVARERERQTGARRDTAKARFEGMRRRREIEGLVVRWCDSAWPHLDVRQEYISLLWDKEAMLRAAKGKMDEADVDAIRTYAQRARNDGFDDSDEGAFTYLDHLLNGTIEERYRHIVVDEAQDISPVEFKLLSAASTNNSFTVMGDLAQRLTPYRGIQRWSEIGRLLGRDETTVQEARLSYRANKHITRFTNRVLRLYDKNIPAPIPFGREGHRPEYHRHASVSDMYEYVIQSLPRIRSMEGMANASIAILTRDRANLNRFQRYCESEGLGDIELIGSEHYHASGAVLARIPDVRGLEYDAVLVLGVNESFASTAFNQRLLYVAMTRAKHYLALHWFGKQSPILASLYDGGVRMHNHTSGQSRG